MIYKVPHYGLRLVREGTHNVPSVGVNNSFTSDRVLTHLLGDKPVEHLVVLMLDGHQSIVGCSTVAIGGIHGLQCAVRDVFRAVVAGNAAGFIMGHNHPSNNPTPSDQDIAFTHKIVAASEVMGIPLLDHVIVTPRGGGYVSMLDKGLLKP